LLQEERLRAMSAALVLNKDLRDKDLWGKDPRRGSDPHAGMPGQAPLDGKADRLPRLLAFPTLERMLQ
jgi:hypothetical protein